MSRVYKYINATGAYDPRPRKPYGVRIDPTGAISMIRDENEAGHDIHTAKAAEMFNVPYSAVTPEQRQKAKTHNFMEQYGAASAYLAGLTPEEAEKRFEEFNKLQHGGMPTARTLSDKPNETSMNKQHPYWNKDAMHISMMETANKSISTHDIADVVDGLAEVINRHMEAQGFWDDEDQIIGALHIRCSFATRESADDSPSILFEHLKAIATRWKNAEKYMLINTELTECIEGDRAGNNAKSDKIPEFTQLEEEMADVIVRVLDFAGRRKLRIGAALIAKMEYNASRPFRHGKKF